MHDDGDFAGLMHDYSTTKGRILLRRELENLMILRERTYEIIE